MKYSIIIPTRNKVEYLKYAVESVIDQGYHDYELIVSNNHSSDNTQEYLDSIKSEHLKIIRPSESLSMSKHFEFAIKVAIGEWITVIGDDDALQPFYFTLLDSILSYVSDIEVINCKPSYYFWNESKFEYNGRVVTMDASPIIRKVNSRRMLLRVLYTNKSYIEVPKFYTGTVFRKTYLDRLLTMQDDTIFTSVNPDANSAALILRTTNNYLHCETPFSWIGTSPKSTGYNHFNIKTNHLVNITVKDFSSLNTKDQLVSFFDQTYFLKVPDLKWFFIEALFQSDKFYKLKYSAILNFFLKRHIMLTSVYYAMVKKIENDKTYEVVKDRLTCELKISPWFMNILVFIFQITFRPINFLHQVFVYFKFTTFPSLMNGYFRLRSNDSNLYPTIKEASKASFKLFVEQNVMDSLKFKNI